MRTVLLLPLLFALACQRHAPPSPLSPFPALPDTVYTASGATPVILVDSIVSPDSGRMILGQYWFTRNHIYVSRQIASEKVRRKVAEHERCHVVLHESGLMMHTQPWYAELLCDAFANAAIAQLERQKR